MGESDKIVCVADDFRFYLRAILAGEILSRSASRRAFEMLFSGNIGEVLTAGFLTALQVRGARVSEISGAAEAMRDLSLSLSAPLGSIDIVGTGGDARGTLNISTASAFVVAGAGVVVAKHGNRAVTSRSGSADVLEALGVVLDSDIERIERALLEANIGFLFARHFHPCMQYISAVRQELGVRTIFNILGPLCNPARVKHLLLGVYDRSLLRIMAEAASALSVECVWVVHGSDGLDELSTTGVNEVCEYRAGEFREFELSPRDFGLARASLGALQGGSARENAVKLEALLDGERGAYRDIVLMNSAAGLVIAGAADDLLSAKVLAEASIDTGKARGALDNLRRILSV